MPKYKVSDTREVSTLTQTGTERKFYRVWIITEFGATGSVDVAPADWNKERLAEILEAKADELDLAYQVGQL